MPTVNYSYSASFNPATYFPAFDPTGTLAANRVTGEKHTLTAANGRDFHFIVPLFGPFFGFAGSLSLMYTPAAGVPRPLLEGIDYVLAFQFIGASRGTAKPVYGGISFLNNTLTGVIELAYRTLGGNWTLGLAAISEILANTITNPRVTSWEQVIDSPITFPVLDHEWNLVDLVGAKQIVQSIEGVAQAIAARPAPVLPVGAQEHINNFANPHGVTKAQVGLGLVQNYGVATSTEATQGLSNSLYMTPASTKAAIELAQDSANAELDAHLEDTANPHSVTKAQVGLNNVQNFAIANEIESKTGTSNSLYMTPLGVKESIDSNVPEASNVVKGKASLNLGDAAGDDTSNSDALTAAGLVAMLQAPSTNALKSAVRANSPIPAVSANPANLLERLSDGLYFGVTSPFITYLCNMPMVKDQSSPGSLMLRSSGVGNNNLAGLSFHNEGYYAVKLGLRADGYFGLGGWSRDAWSWYSGPDGHMVAAGNVIAYSDPRLKENIVPIEGAVNKLRRLHGVYFTWKEGIAHVACKAGKLDLGILADEVQAVFPEIVFDSMEIEGETYKAVAYDKLVPVLIEAVKEQSDTIAAHTLVIKMLIKRLEKLELKNK
jgi:Chaperone of endosialidase